jgi:hypothetical protein
MSSGITLSEMLSCGSSRPFPTNDDLVQKNISIRIGFRIIVTIPKLVSYTSIISYQIIHPV